MALLATVPLVNHPARHHFDRINWVTMLHPSALISIKEVNKNTSLPKTILVIAHCLHHLIDVYCHHLPHLFIISLSFPHLIIIIFISISSSSSSASHHHFIVIIFIISLSSHGHLPHLVIIIISLSSCHCHCCFIIIIVI